MAGRPTRAFAVHGTWDFSEKAWFRKGSTFYEFAKANNIFLTGSPTHDVPFEWSGDVNGAFGFKGRDTKHRDWRAGGMSFKYFIEQHPLINRNIIIHSHALQIVAYSEVDLNNIITIGSPIRNDMELWYKNMLLRAKAWKHIYDKKWDRMGFLGQLFDGKWFGSRRCDIVGVDNCEVANISHSKILRDETYMKMWVDNGWFDFLRS